MFTVVSLSVAENEKDKISASENLACKDAFRGNFALQERQAARNGVRWLQLCPPRRGKGEQHGPDQEKAEQAIWGRLLLELLKVPLQGSGQGIGQRGKGKMMEVGRLCVKVAGRGAGKSCVIVEAVDDNFVVADGQVKRKRYNISHLEPLQHKLPIASGASHDEVVAALKAVGVDVFIKEKRARKVKSAAAAAENKAPAKAASKKKAKS